MRLLILIVLLSSCGSVPDKPEFQGVPEYEPVTVNINPQCKEGYCRVSEDTLTKIFLVIDELNDELADRMEAIAHCKYNINLASYELTLLKNEATKDKVIAMASGAVKTVVCIGGIIWK